MAGWTRALPRLLALAGVAGLATLAWATGAFAWMAEPENVRAFLVDNGPLGPLIYVASFALLQPFGMPGVFFVIPASLVWPPEVAVPLSVAGAVLAGGVAYGATHGIGYTWVEQRLPRSLRHATAHAREHPFRTALFVRLVFFLFSPAHWALAIAGIPLRPFLLGSLLGFTPFMILLVVSGRQASLWALRQDTWVWAGLGALLAVLWLGVRILRGRRERAEADEEGVADA